MVIIIVISAYCNCDYNHLNQLVKASPEVNCYCNWFVLIVNFRNRFDKALMKNSSECRALNFTNILQSAFVYESVFAAFTVGLCNFFAKKYWKKAVRKILVK